MRRALSRKNLWESAPPFVRSVVGRFVSAVPRAYLLGADFRRQMKLAQGADRWSAEQAREYQLAQVRRICALAYDKTSYYQRAFDDAGANPRDMRCLDDFSRLPFITKQTVFGHLDEMCAMPPASAGVDYVSTGGTSGEPLQFHINSNRSAMEYAHLVTSWSRVGYRLGDALAVFRGRVVSQDRDGLRHEYDPLLGQHYYGNFHMTDENMRRYLDHLRGIGPCYLHVYPSSVAVLAHFIGRSKIEPPGNIRGIIAESEIVYPEQRELCEAVFSCRYYSCYGHTEKLVLAAECEHSSNYHVCPSYGYFELLDEQGNAVTQPGATGEIVGTGFINTVVPFIRYRTGDFATYVGDHCEQCGRQQVIIRDIVGHRTQEMLVASDGSCIGWTALNMHDDTFRHVRRFQFFQDSPGKAILKIVPSDGFAPDEKRRILDHLAVKLSDRVSVEICLCEEIPLSPVGKVTYIDQRIETARITS